VGEVGKGICMCVGNPWQEGLSLELLQKYREEQFQIATVYSTMERVTFSCLGVGEETAENVVMGKSVYGAATLSSRHTYIYICIYMLHIKKCNCNCVMANVMNKFVIYLSIYFCLTCFGLSSNPSSEADVQLRPWFKSAGYGVSARALTP
jgi:hypothetical protein